MKIENINNLFRKIGEWQMHHRVAVLVAVLLFAVTGFSGLFYVTTVNDRDQWFENKEQIKVLTKEFEAQFGNNDNINVLIEADDVFDPHVLTMIQDLGNELLEQVPYANDITSLTNMEISVGTSQGLHIINPFESGIPSDPNEIEKIRKLVLSRPALADKIVSSDSKETWLSLSLLEYPDQEVWSKETNKDPMFQAGEAAIKVITNDKWKSNLYTLKAAGMPYTETEDRDLIQSEATKRVLLGFVVMVVLLVYFVRNFWGVLVTASVSIGGLFIVFGFMGWLGIGVNSHMVTLPMLLGMTLSVAYSMHIINSFKREQINNPDNKEAAIASIEKTGWPLFFTVVTTVASLSSFMSVGIIAITWAGLTSIAVILTNWFLVVTLIPIFLSYGKKQISTQKNSLWLENLMEKSGHLVIKRKKTILITFIVLLVIIAPGIFKISVNVDVFKMMGLKVPYVKRIYEISQSKLGSYLSYNVSIKYDEPDKIKEPQVLKNFETLINNVGAFTLTKKNESNISVFSVLDILKEMNQTLHEDNVAHYTIPNSRETVAQLLFLYEISGGTKLFDWIDEDYSMLRLQVQLARYDANMLAEDLKTIKLLGKNLFPNAKVSIIGSAAEFAELNKKIVLGELKSISLSLLLISVLLVLVFSSLKTGLIGMIPNLAPMIVLGGWMGYFHLSLDMMTMTVLPMLLGIAVDDTIHFINHIKYEFEMHNNYEKAIVNSFKSVGITLTMTTIILSLGFASYMFSPINNMVRIGFLSALGLITALVVDYFIAPILILYTKPFGKEKVIQIKDGSK